MARQIDINEQHNKVAHSILMIQRTQSMLNQEIIVGSDIVFPENRECWRALLTDLITLRDDVQSLIYNLERVTE